MQSDEKQREPGLRRPRPASQREGEILDLVTRAGGNMRIQAIAQALDVTEETVRRNVRRLSDQGLVQKVHGGVHLLKNTIELSFAERMDENPVPKMRIAAHVAALIQNGQSLFLDVGSTTAYIAEALKNHSGLFVVTNSVVVAYALAARNDNRVFIPGGELRAHDGGVFGAGVSDFMQNFRADLAILSAAAIDARTGFMLYDLEEARVTRAMMARADRRIVAADSSKFGRKAPIAVGDPAQVNMLVCEKAPPEDLARAARGWGTEIVVAR
ncbi:DeoR/GlpR family DNA-binding transcription regulator [Albidovulum sp.]